MSTTFQLRELKGATTGLYRLDAASGSDSPASGLSASVVTVQGGAALGSVSSSTGLDVLYAKRLGAGRVPVEGVDPVVVRAVDAAQAPATPASQEQVAELIQTALDDLPDPGTSVASSPCWFEWVTPVDSGAIDTPLTADWSPVEDGITAGTDVVVDTDATKVKVVTAGVYLCQWRSPVLVPSADPGLNAAAYPVLNDDSVGPLYELGDTQPITEGVTSTLRETFVLPLAADDTLTFPVTVSGAGTGSGVQVQQTLIMTRLGDAPAP